MPVDAALYCRLTGSCVCLWSLTWGDSAVWGECQVLWGEQHTVPVLLVMACHAAVCLSGCLLCRYEQQAASSCYLPECPSSQSLPLEADLGQPGRLGPKPGPVVRDVYVTVLLHMACAALLAYAAAHCPDTREGLPAHA